MTKYDKLIKGLELPKYNNTDNQHVNYGYAVEFNLSGDYYFIHDKDTAESFYKSGRKVVGVRSGAIIEALLLLKYDKKLGRDKSILYIKEGGL